MFSATSYHGRLTNSFQIHRHERNQQKKKLLASYSTSSTLKTNMKLKLPPPPLGINLLVASLSVYSFIESFQHKRDYSRQKTSHQIRGVSIESCRKSAKGKSPKKKLKFARTIENWPISSIRYMRACGGEMSGTNSIFCFALYRICSVVFSQEKPIYRIA